MALNAPNLTSEIMAAVASVSVPSPGDPLSAWQSYGTNIYSAIAGAVNLHIEANTMVSGTYAGDQISPVTPDPLNGGYSWSVSSNIRPSVLQSAGASLSGDSYNLSAWVSAWQNELRSQIVLEASDDSGNVTLSEARDFSPLVFSISFGSWDHSGQDNHLIAMQVLSQAIVLALQSTSLGSTGAGSSTPGIGTVSWDSVV